VFPAAYIEGVGLTPFKIVSEYVIAGIFLAAAYGLYRNRGQFEPGVARALIWSLVIAAGAELLFTTYVGVYDLPNRLGHFLTIVSYYLVYIAIVKTGIVRPYTLLERSREELRSLSHHLVNVQEAERKTLSRELHDRSGQSMTALKLSLGVLKRSADNPDAVRARADELLQMTDYVMTELHDLAVNLRPSALDRYGLVPALEQYLASFRKQNQVEAGLVATGLDEERLPDEVETAIYRIVQESLTNVARHARADQVHISVARRNGQVAVTIQDDGQGFDVGEAWARGRLGLLGMRERAELLGGQMEIASQPGAGATVSVQVPVFQDGWTHKSDQ
jgi:signal transduction histidine kinase